MSYKISKELFEAVMGFKTKSITIGNFIFWEMEDEYKPDYGISINDFFFKCKEWALFSRDIEIRSFKTKNIVDGVYCLATSSKMQRTFKSSSEQQAVFDACQWILDNKDKQ